MRFDRQIRSRTRGIGPECADSTRRAHGAQKRPADGALATERDQAPGLRVSTYARRHRRGPGSRRAEALFLLCNPRVSKTDFPWSIGDIRGDLATEIRGGPETLSAFRTQPGIQHVWRGLPCQRGKRRHRPGVPLPNLAKTRTRMPCLDNERGPRIGTRNSRFPCEHRLHRKRRSGQPVRRAALRRKDCFPRTLSQRASESWNGKQ